MPGLRTKLMTALLIATVTGCATPPTAAAPTTAGGGQTVMPVSAKGRQLVALLESYGGLAPAARKEIRPPVVAVYSDGLTVASAERRITLTRDQVATLVRTLRRDLAGQPATPSPTGGPRIFDATTTRIAVRSGGTLRSVTAYALQETRSENTYPKGLYHALDTLSALAARVARKSTAYTSGRVLLIAEPRPGQQGKPWPSSVPQPSASATGVVLKKLSGAKARAATLKIHRKKQSPWPLYQDAHGHVWTVSWRYLLPSE